jgi:hypothetical protein
LTDDLSRGFHRPNFVASFVEIAEPGPSPAAIRPDAALAQRFEPDRRRLSGFFAAKLPTSLSK